MRLLLFLTLFANFSFGQANYRVEKLDDQVLTRILTRLNLLTDKNTGELTIRVFTVSNSPGSAGGPSGEVTHQLYITVSEHDELPTQNLFTFGPLYNANAKGWTGTSKEQDIKLEHGPANSRQLVTLRITLDTVQVKK